MFLTPTCSHSSYHCIHTGTKKNIETSQITLRSVLNALVYSWLYTYCGKKHFFHLA